MEERGGIAGSFQPWYWISLPPCFRKAARFGSGESITGDILACAWLYCAPISIFRKSKFGSWKPKYLKALDANWWPAALGLRSWVGPVIQALQLPFAASAPGL